MSDNDLIRRGDALAAVQGFGYGWHAEEVIAALPAVTVGVRKLVWEGDGHWHSGDNEGWLEEANTPFGWGYAIEFGTTRQSPWVVSNTFGETLTGFDDPDAAKAAAQADYEQRILAALEPVAAPDPALRPTMTDMMVDPNTLDTFMEAKPLPPDPAAIREAWEKAYWRMRSYAVHDNDCKLNKPPRFDGPCSCGLTAALEEALALISKGAAEPTEYERKVAQMKKDFPNGI